MSNPPYLMGDLTDTTSVLCAVDPVHNYAGVLDLLHLRTPIRPQHVPAWRGYVSSRSAILSKTRGLFDVRGLPCRIVGNIDIGPNGETIVSDLHTTFEKLESSHSGVAFRVYDGRDGIHYPCIELKYSPAKCLQAHNVFGPKCLSLAAKIGLLTWSSAYPSIYDMAEIESTEVVQLDFTYSGRLPSHNIGLQVIAYLQNLSSGHCKSRGDGWDTTAYFYAQNSRELGLKFYLKFVEFLHELNKVRKSAEAGNALAQRRLAIMSDPKLIAFAENLLRIEVTVKKRWLEKQGYSTVLVDMIALQRGYDKLGLCILTEWWHRVTKPVFKSFEGATVTIFDDEKILPLLEQHHFRVLPSGKISYAYARNLFATYRDIRHMGWTSAKNAICERTFFRRVKDIEMCGISRAHLQNLKTDTIKNNVIPLLRFVHVDVLSSSQRPDWYVEPVIDIDLISKSCAL